MKIIISKFAGFCSGAKRAYDLTTNIAKEDNKNLHILGDLLHNEDVIKKIKSLGVKKVNKIQDIKKGRIVITAHGDSKNIFDEAKNIGINIINTTCPKVMKVQQIVKKFYQDKSPIIIIGDKNHKEVKGINGWCGKSATIISKLDKAKKLDFNKFKNAVIVSQTTQNLKKFQEIIKFLEKKIENIKVFNTICDATRNRQTEARKIAKENDAIIVIGGQNSANSKKLFEIAKENNQKTFFIENAEELNLKNFSNLNSIGITAGASTPDWVIKEVYQKLKTLS